MDSRHTAAVTDDELARADDALARAVEGFARRAAGPAADIHARARGGAVTLSGAVPSAVARDALRDLVAACEGVRSVTCDLAVAAPGSVQAR